MTEDLRTGRVETLFAQATEHIESAFNQYPEWKDLEPERGKKEIKTAFFSNFGRLFQEIPQLRSERKTDLINNYLVKALVQYPDVGLILSGDLIGQERKSAIRKTSKIFLDEAGGRIITAIFEHEEFDQMSSIDQEAFLNELTEDVGEYLWGIGLMRSGKSEEKEKKRRQRKEHTKLLFENLFIAYPQVGERIAQAIALRPELEELAKKKEKRKKVSITNAGTAFSDWETPERVFRRQRAKQKSANKALYRRCKALSFDERGRWEGSLEDGKMITVRKREARPESKHYNAAGGHDVLIQEGTKAIVYLCTNSVDPKTLSKSQMVVGKINKFGVDKPSREEVSEVLKEFGIPKEAVIIKSSKKQGTFFLVQNPDWFVSLLPEKAVVEEPPSLSPPGSPPKEAVVKEVPPVEPLPAHPSAGQSLRGVVRGFTTSDDKQSKDALERIVAGLNQAITRKEQRVFFNQASKVAEELAGLRGQGVFQQKQRAIAEKLESAIAADLAALEAEPVEEKKILKKEEPLPKEVKVERPVSKEQAFPIYETPAEALFFVAEKITAIRAGLTGQDHQQARVFLSDALSQIGGMVDQIPQDQYEAFIGIFSDIAQFMTSLDKEKASKS